MKDEAWWIATLINNQGGDVKNTEDLLPQSMREDISDDELIINNSKKAQEDADYILSMLDPL